MACRHDRAFQSGAYGIAAAVARPTLVKALVSVEPRRCSASDADVKGAFSRVPVLTMFGDFFGTDVGDWPGRMAECIGLVNRIKAIGGVAENIHLTDKGVRGNSHMLMMDTNNQELAAMIATWLRPRRRKSTRRSASASRPDRIP
jgi:hypothetical protein